jgi:hypothetical protein
MGTEAREREEKRKRVEAMKAERHRLAEMEEASRGEEGKENDRDGEEIELRPIPHAPESWIGSDEDDGSGKEERSLEDDIDQSSSREGNEEDEPPSTPKDKAITTDGLLETPRTAAKAPVRLEHVFHDADEEQEDMISSSNSAIPNFVVSPGETV